jgi:glycosyltransferase involved in cell wall biosynthesis
MTEERQTILYIHASDELYGSDAMLLRVIDSLDAQRFRAVVVLPTDAGAGGLLSKALSARGVKTVHGRIAVLRRRYFTPTGILAYTFRLVFSTVWLLTLMHKESADIVHSNTLAVLPGALAACMLRKRHVWHVHEIIERPVRLWRWTSWLAPRLSHVVVAVSEAVRSHLCAGDARNYQRAIVIMNAIDPRVFESAVGSGRTVREAWGVSPGQPVIGLIGRVSNWKGQSTLLRAAKTVVERRPEARFVIVGGTVSGQEELLDDLKAIASREGVAHAVIFQDFREDIPAVFDACDVIVVPSTRPEPFGTVAAEAMAAGKPVVASRSGGLIEVVQHETTGLLFQPGDPGALANALLRLLENPAERAAMGRRGAARAREAFSLDRFTAEWNGLYESFR